MKTGSWWHVSHEANEIPIKGRQRHLKKNIKFLWLHKICLFFLFFFFFWGGGGECLSYVRVYFLVCVCVSWSVCFLVCVCVLVLQFMLLDALYNNYCLPAWPVEHTAWQLAGKIWITPTRLNYTVTTSPLLLVRHQWKCFQYCDRPLCKN